MSYQQSGIASMLVTRLRQPVLIAGVLVAGATMVAGAAQATTWKSTCTFGTAGECTGTSGVGWTSSKTPPLPLGPAPGNPPLQLGDKLLNIVSYSFANGIGNPAPTGHFDFEWQDSDTATVFGDDNWNVRTVFDTALTGLLPTPANDAVGTLNYTLEIIGTGSTFKNVQVDSSTTGSGNSVTKAIISPVVNLISTNGSIANAPISGTLVNVTDTYRVANSGGLNSFNNGFTQSDNFVPGPLPLFGLGAAFGFSRRLRNRIKGFRQA